MKNINNINNSYRCHFHTPVGDFNGQPQKDRHIATKFFIKCLNYYVTDICKKDKSKFLDEENKNFKACIKAGYMKDHDMIISIEQI